MGEREQKRGFRQNVSFRDCCSYNDLISFLEMHLRYDFVGNGSLVGSLCSKWLSMAHSLCLSRLWFIGASGVNLGRTVLECSPLVQSIGHLYHQFWKLPNYIFSVECTSDFVSKNLWIICHFQDCLWLGEQRDSVYYHLWKTCWLNCYSLRLIASVHTCMFGHPFWKGRC